jgi:hypothetical protein
MLLMMIYISALLFFSSEGILVPTNVPISLPRPSSDFTDEANLSQSPTPTPTPTPPPPREMSGRRIGHAFTEGGTPCDRTQQEQLDLSGNYMGTLKYPVAGLSGESTLVIRRQEFTLSQGDKKLVGQIAVTRTCDYLAVALRFSEASSAVASTETLPVSVSVRAVKEGKRLWLVSVPGEPRELTFKPRGTSIWRWLKIWKWVP